MARITKAQQAEINAVELKAVQAAELKRLRAEKRAKAKEEAAQAAVQPEAELVLDKEHFTPEQEDARMQQRMMDAAAVLTEGFDLPSWKRTIVSAIMGLAAAGGVGYLVGTIGGMLIVGAVALTGMMWLGWLIYAISIIISMWLGAKACGAVFGYIAGGRVDEHAAAVKNKVVGWFSSKAPLSFTGAFEKASV